MLVSSVGFPAPTVLDFRATEMTMTEAGVPSRSAISGGEKNFRSNAFCCCMQKRVLYSSDARSLHRGTESEDRLGGRE